MTTRRVLSLLAFPLLFLALLVLTVVYWSELWTLFSSPQTLREWIRSTGVVAPLVFVAVQAFQVVFFFIPGEIPQVAGGYMFGLWLGTVLSLVGITLGATFNFVIARLLGVPFVNVLFAAEKVERTRRIASSPKARLSFFLFFLIPGCYLIIETSTKFAFHSWSILEGSPDPGGIPYRYLIKSCIPIGFIFVLLQGISLGIKSAFTLMGKDLETEMKN